MSRTTVKSSMVNSGTGPDEVPTNADLPNSSSVGNDAGQIPTNDILRDEYDFETMPLVDGNPIVARGSNSDGKFTIWADGTIRQWMTDLMGGDGSGNPITVVFDFPVPFVASNPTPSGGEVSVITSTDSAAYVSGALSFIHSVDWDRETFLVRFARTNTTNTRHITQAIGRAF